MVHTELIFSFGWAAQPTVVTTRLIQCEVHGTAELRQIRQTVLMSRLVVTITSAENTWHNPPCTCSVLCLRDARVCPTAYVCVCVCASSTHPLVLVGGGHLEDALSKREVLEDLAAVLALRELRLVLVALDRHVDVRLRLLRPHALVRRAHQQLQPARQSYHKAQK